MAVGLWCREEKMRRFMVGVITVLFFVIIVLQSAEVDAAEPIFDLAICADTTRFNPNEKLTFSIYFIGAGNVSSDVLLFYVDDEIYVDRLLAMGREITFGLQDKGTNMQYCENFMITAKQGFVGYSDDEINPLFGPSYSEGRYIRPLEVTLASKPETHPGDHTLKVVYMYKGTNGTWGQTSELIRFHINSFTEQYEIIGFVWNFFVPFLGAFLGIIAGLFLHYHQGEKKNLLPGEW